MCGIAGIAAIDGTSALDPAPLARMLACVRHRGPDDEGRWAAPGIVLGHRRLSVIDVTGGHQPLHGARESTVAVVNGEVYNYRELREELAARGHTFRTASDSEVAAQAYDTWGLDFLDRLDGMFALALWDGARRRLILARDRMGEKPLYHAVVGNLLVFASELSAILAHPAVEPAIDPAALREYLMLEYVPAPHTMIRNVSKLAPGTALILESGRTHVRRWWSLDPHPDPLIMPYRAAVQELRARLDRAVQSRLVSDVPLGVLLSGGLDSSTVAALAARHGALETFSIGFEERSFDESSHARAVAAHIGSRHHEQVVRGSEMTDLVPRLGAVLDEPIGDASVLPTWVLSRFARENVTVALGGDGGDELFAGYPMHQGHRVANALRVPRRVASAAAYLAAKLPVSHDNFSLGFKVETFLRGAGEPPPLSHALWMSSFPPDAHATLLQPHVFREAVQSDPMRIVRRTWHESAGAPPLARAQHLDASLYLPNDVLTKVDRASMAVALEVRAPFLARDVVQFAFSLPDAYRMRGLTGKRILRDAVRDLLPASILQRPKKGFGMPVAAWLNGPLAPLVNDVLGADALRSGGLFDPAAVGRMLAEHRSRRRDHRKPLWTLLAFELWRRAHLPGSGA